MVVNAQAEDPREARQLVPLAMLQASSGTVTQIDTGSGLTGGPITTTGTIGLASVASGTFLGNSSGSNAAPSAQNVGTGLTFTAGTLSISFGITTGTAAEGNDSRIVGALQSSGGTMTGALVLAGNPTSALEAATKQYVDSAVAGGITQTGGISAAGNTQGTATAINSNYNVVEVVASGQGVRLEGSGPQVVLNRGSNSLRVYPMSGGQISNLGLNAPAIIPAGGVTSFVKVSSTQWWAF